MLKGQMLIFFGCTGVGKSTQIRLLAHSLKKKGLRVKCAQVKIHYPLTRLLREFYGKEDSSQRWIAEAPCHPSGRRAQLFRSSITLDLIMNIFSFLVISVFKIQIFLLLKYIVIVEEHVLGIVTDYLHVYRTCRLNFKLVNALTNLLLRFMPKETIVVILVANSFSLEERWTRRETLFGHREYLKTHRAMIEFCQKNMNGHIRIETNKKRIAEVYNEILSELSAHMR